MVASGLPVPSTSFASNQDVTLVSVPALSAFQAWLHAVIT